ncbi:MAG: Rha family transcriptional regulator [Mariniphaga sp.]
MTNSLIVAKVFEKHHRHVMDAIRNIIQSAENSAHFYKPSTYKDAKRRTLEKFLMNREGFMLLAMGFTGRCKEQN